MKLYLPDVDGEITHVAGKKLERPIPFKKGDNLFLKAKDYLPDDITKWELEWVEF